MNKKLLMLGLAFSLFAGLIACSSEEAVTAKTQNKALIDKDAYINAFRNRAKTGISSNYISPFLFDYTTNDQAQKNQEEASVLIVNHYYEQLNNGSGINEMIISTTTANGKSNINQIVYLNATTLTEVDVLVRNPIKGTLETSALIGGYKFWHDLLYGGCAEGWTNLGSVSYTTPEALSLFLGQVTGTYTYDNAAPGYDINFNQQFGLSGVTVCAQKVKKF